MEGLVAVLDMEHSRGVLLHRVRAIQGEARQTLGHLIILVLVGAEREQQVKA
jgi:hypothetical protein